MAYACLDCKDTGSVRVPGNEVFPGHLVECPSCPKGALLTDGAPCAICAAPSERGGCGLVECPTGLWAGEDEGDEL